MSEKEAARAEYRAKRASCSRHSAKAFDEIARHIVAELCDGEEPKPSDWTHAAAIICSGQDYA